jgi:50S ribosomal subunit-associated GTPase HflX
LAEETGRDVLAISAATGAGLDRLVQSIATALDRREAAP